MLEKILTAARKIAAPLGIALTLGCASSTAHSQGRVFDDWRQAYDMEQVRKCEAQNSLGDCVLAIVEPDQEALAEYCGSAPFGYEIQAGDENPSSIREPSFVIFCTEKDYRQSLRTDEISDMYPLPRLFPELFSGHRLKFY